MYHSIQSLCSGGTPPLLSSHPHVREFVINDFICHFFVFFHLLGKNTTICCDASASQSLEEFTILCASSCAPRAHIKAIPFGFYSKPVFPFDLLDCSILGTGTETMQSTHVERVWQRLGLVGAGGNMCTVVQVWWEGRSSLC